MKRVIILSLQLGLTLFALGGMGLSKDGPKPRVFVIPSETWSMPRTLPGGGLIPDFLLGSRGGGSPQTAEIIKTFGERCKESIVNISREKSDYIVLLEHEGGKGLARVDNKFAIFDPLGDAIESGSTRSLGNSVDDACAALKKDWKERNYGQKAHTKRSEPEVTATPKPITTLDRREAGGTESTSAVTFQSNPDGADIEIDGKFAGNAPSLLQLKVGDHNVTVKRSGYKTWEKSISVVAGGNVLVRADLEKETPVVVWTTPPTFVVPNQPSNSTEPVSRESKTASGIELVWIPAGSFQMGATDGDADEKPFHRVTISEGFWMGKYEVTQLHWFSEMDANPSNFAKCGGNCPVENVSWEEAKRFIERLNARNDGFIYSLPTEAQWEYAARAGSSGPYAGNVDDLGWHMNNSGKKTNKVGLKAPNAFGLFDMHGNVWEMCEDVYRIYPGGTAAGAKGTESGQFRVIRGGSWINIPFYLRSSYRGRNPINTRDYVTGFRVVARAK